MKVLTLIYSFKDYIKIEVNYELDIPLPIDVNYYESQNSILIQAADFIANAVNAKYENGHEYFYDIIKPRIDHVEHFPRKYFGTDKVIRINTV